MNRHVSEAVQEMIDNWNRMQSSGFDDAGDDADRFQNSFYAMIDLLRDWFAELAVRPKTVEEALGLPEVERLYEQLPPPLLLNFETELELIVEGLERSEDARYE